MPPLPPPTLGALWRELLRRFSDSEGKGLPRRNVMQRDLQGRARRGAASMLALFVLATVLVGGCSAGKTPLEAPALPYVAPPFQSASVSRTPLRARSQRRARPDSFPTAHTGRPYAAQRV